MPVLLQPSTYPSARAAYPLVHARDDDPTPKAPAGDVDDKAPLGGPFGPNTSVDTSKFSIPLTGTVFTQTQTLTLDRGSTTSTSSSSLTTAAQSTVTVVKVVPPPSSVTDQAGSSATVAQQSSATAAAASSTATQQTLATSSASSQTQSVNSSNSGTNLASSSAAQESTAAQQGTSSSLNTQDPSTTQPPKGTTTPANNGATQDAGSTTFVTITLPGGQITVSPVANAVHTSDQSQASLAPVGGAKSTNNVSPAVIAVPIILIFLIFIGVGVFLFRRHSLAKRERKRNTWGAGLYPQAPPPSSFGSTERAYEEARAAGMAPNAYAAAPPPQPPMMQFTPAPPMAPPPMMNMAPPPQAYNSPAMLTPNMSPYSAIGPGAPMGGFGAGAIVPSGAAAQASVKCSFVPSMPDELPISAGEPIRLLAEYDDGWALCENTRGEQGMVPLDCLDRGNGVPTTPTSTASFNGSRSQRRASSLVGAGIRGPMQY